MTQTCCRESICTTALLPDIAFVWCAKWDVLRRNAELRLSNSMRHSVGLYGNRNFESDFERDGAD